MNIVQTDTAIIYSVLTEKFSEVNTTSLCMTDVWRNNV